jgi:hypothetical protein
MEQVQVTFSTDPDYWGEVGPDQDDIDTLKGLILKVDPEVNVNVVDGDYNNDEAAQEILDIAWGRFCRNEKP